MSAAEIDAYLADVPEPKLSTLEAMRRSILAVVPDAEQCISYSMPAFRVHGKVVAGFAAFKDHVAFLPHSGTTLATVAEHTGAYPQTKSSLHVPVDAPLPDELVAVLVRARLAEIEAARR